MYIVEEKTYYISDRTETSIAAVCHYEISKKHWDLLQKYNGYYYVVYKWNNELAIFNKEKWYEKGLKRLNGKCSDSIYSYNLMEVSELDGKKLIKRTERIIDDDFVYVKPRVYLHVLDKLKCETYEHFNNYINLYQIDGEERLGIDIDFRKMV